MLLAYHFFTFFTFFRYMNTTKDRFLIAVDLEHSDTKPIARIQNAYDDPHGITSRFTLNALTHVNKVAGLNFDIAQWKHDVVYDAETSRIITHVEALSLQIVTQKIDDPNGPDDATKEIKRYEKGEKIFIEQSRKFNITKMEQYAKGAGLKMCRNWSDGDFLIVELRLKMDKSQNDWFGCCSSERQTDSTTTKEASKV